MAGVAAFMAFLVTIVFVFALRPVAEKVGLVDEPGGRKRHDGEVPLIGGIAMSIGLAFGGTLAFDLDIWAPLALGIYLLVSVGTIDDRFELPATVRLIAQTCAALLVVYGAGVTIDSLGAPLFFDVSLGFLTVPFSLLFILTIINAINVIDGLDGLAGGLAFVALASLAVVSAGTGFLALAVVLAASVAAFLIFNLPLRFNRGTHCFMGDAGSTFLGLAIATLGIALSQGATAKMSPVIGLWFVAVPIFDFFSAIIRRIEKGESPLAPDHDHLHHILNAGGKSRRGGALLVMLSMGLVSALLGLTGHFLAVPDGIMLLLWFGAGIAYYLAMKRPGALLRLIRAPEETLAQRRATAA